METDRNQISKRKNGKVRFLLVITLFAALSAMPFITWQANWYSDFMRLMPVGTEGSEREFFWKVYSPFMNRILDTL